MRAGAPDEVLSGSAGWEARVWSWLGPRLLTASPVPLLRGRLTVDVTAAVPERVSLVVPRFADGVDWYPGDDPEHPLARYGQELAVSVVVSSALPADGVSEWETRLGRFLVVSWDEGEDGSVRVEAVGRLRRLADAQLTAPTQPAAGATLVSEARRLMPAGMSVAIDPALVNRTCPSGMSWSADRLSALQEIADAWPARLRTDEWGQVVLAAPLPEVPAPVVVLRTGERGTVVHALRSDTREGSYNEVVATSSAPGAEGVSAVARVLSGPMAVTGEYGPVTRRWASPLIATRAQALASARTILGRSVLPTRRLPVTCAPDPRVDVDDAVEVRHGDLDVVRRTASGAVQLRNEALNPGPSTSAWSGTVEVRRNLALRPQPTTSTSYNYQNNGGELGTSTVVTGAVDGPEVAPGVRATAYLRRTITTAKTGSGTGGFYQYAASPYSATIGQQGVVSAYVRSSHAVQVSMANNWRTTANGVVGTATGPTITLPAGQWVRVSGAAATATAPADHLGWWVTIAAASILPVGGTFDITAVLPEVGADVLPYFDGGISPDPLLSASWVGLAGDSPSVLTGRQPLRWAGSWTRRYLVTDEGAPAIEFVREGTGSLYGDPHGTHATAYHPALAGRWFALGVEIKPLTATVASTMRIILAPYNGANLNGFAAQAGASTPGVSGQWQRSVHAAQITADGAGAGYLRALAWPNTSAGGAFRVRRAVVAYADTEAAARAAVAQHFDGGTRLPDGRRGRWTGTPGASPSQLLAPQVVTESYEPTDRTWGYVVAYDLPLTVHDGPMRIDLGVVS